MPVIQNGSRCFIIGIIKLKMESSKVFSGKRIEYIDALRGFTMILVVLSHVAIFCVGAYDVPNYHHYLQQLRMPMFFLISGFVLYKVDTVWNLNYIVGFLSRKFVVQILSTSLFFILYVHYCSVDIMQGISDIFKLGYWFTYVLFFFYVFYSIIRFTCRKYEDYVCIVVAGLFYIINWPPLFNSIPISEVLKSVLSIPFWYFFCFFLLGTLLRKHFDFVQALLDKRGLISICVSIYFLLNIYQDVIPGSSGVVVSFSLSISGIVIIFSFFRTNQKSFSKEKLLGRILQYIGRHTLDIYLLHSFFIPRGLAQAVTVFKDYPMPVVEFVYSLVIALIIIGFCLLISNVIRLSPTLAHVLFGVRKKI